MKTYKEVHWTDNKNDKFLDHCISTSSPELLDKIEKAIYKRRLLEWALEIL